MVRLKLIFSVPIWTSPVKKLFPLGVGLSQWWYKAILVAVIFSGPFSFADYDLKEAYQRNNIGDIVWFEKQGDCDVSEIQTMIQDAVRKGNTRFLDAYFKSWVDNLYSYYSGSWDKHIVDQPELQSRFAYAFEAAVEAEQTAVVSYLLGLNPASLNKLGGNELPSNALIKALKTHRNEEIISAILKRGGDTVIHHVVSKVLDTKETGILPQLISLPSGSLILSGALRRDLLNGNEERFRFAVEQGIPANFPLQYVKGYNEWTKVAQLLVEGEYITAEDALFALAVANENIKAAVPEDAQKLRAHLKESLSYALSDWGRRQNRDLYRVNPSRLFIRLAAAGLTDAVEALGMQAKIHRVNPHSQDNEALHSAIDQGKLETAALLVLRFGAKFRPQDPALKKISEHALSPRDRAHIPTLVKHLESQGLANERWSLQRWFQKFAEKSPEISDLRALVESGLIKPNHNDGYYLLTASRQGHYDKVAYLLEKGADTNVTERVNGELVQELLFSQPWDEFTMQGRHGREKFKEGHFKLTPLVLAAMEGNSKCVEALIEKGADIHAGNERALRLAAARGHADIVKILLEKRVDWHAYQDAALIHAVRGEHQEVIQLLENWQNFPQREHLVIAVERDDIPLIERLLKRGAYVAGSKSGEAYPLNTAVEQGNLKAIELLLNHGATFQEEGHKALGLAVKKEKQDVIELLLQRGADPSANNWEALRIAASQRNKKLLRSLIENPALNRWWLKTRYEKLILAAVKEGDTGALGFLKEHMGYEHPRQHDLDKSWGHNEYFSYPGQLALEAGTLEGLKSLMELRIYKQPEGGVNHFENVGMRAMDSEYNYPHFIKFLIEQKGWNPGDFYPRVLNYAAGLEETELLSTVLAHHTFSKKELTEAVRIAKREKNDASNQILKQAKKDQCGSVLSRLAFWAKK